MAQMDIGERLDAIGRGESPDLADIVCADAKAEIKLLRAALGRARRWGVNSTAYHAIVSFDLGQWIDDGMTGELPALPKHLAGTR